MVRDYELMYIVRPDVDEEGLAAAQASVQTLVEAQGGEVVKTTPWGKRRLAYEIERMRDGHYVLLHIRLDSARVKEVERLLHIHDTVFRHLVTLWVETKGKEEEEEDGREEPGRERPRPRAEAAAGEDAGEEAQAVAVGAPAATGGDDGEDGDDLGAAEEEDE